MSCEIHFDTCAYMHETYKSYVKRNVPLYLGQPWIKVKENRSVERLGKVNPTFLYKNELGPEKQTITQELYGQELLGDQVWKRISHMS